MMQCKIIVNTMSPNPMLIDKHKNSTVRHVPVAVALSMTPCGRPSPVMADRLKLVRM